VKTGKGGSQKFEKNIPHLETFFIASHSSDHSTKRNKIFYSLENFLFLRKNVLKVTGYYTTARLHTVESHTGQDPMENAILVLLHVGAPQTECLDPPILL
jgi:hypothetical protein